MTLETIKLRSSVSNNRLSQEEVQDIIFNVLNVTGKYDDCLRKKKSKIENISESDIWCLTNNINEALVEGRVKRAKDFLKFDSGKVMRDERGNPITDFTKETVDYIETNLKIWGWECG